MDWTINQMKMMLEILLQATERNLENIERNRQNSDNFETLFDENIAKQALFVHLKGREDLHSREEFLNTLDTLDSEPIIPEGHYNKEVYLKYWKSYVALLRVFDFNDL